MWEQTTAYVGTEEPFKSLKCSAVLVEYLDGRIDVEYGQTTIARFDHEGHPITEMASEERRATR